MNDNEEMRLIVTKRGEYMVPVSAAQTWAQRYPGSQAPKGKEGWKFWPTHDGWVTTPSQGEDIA